MILKPNTKTMCVFSLNCSGAIWMSLCRPTFSMRLIQMEVAWMKVSRMKADKFN